MRRTRTKRILAIFAGTATIFGRSSRRRAIFLATIPDYPFQEGSSLNAAGINYNTLKAAAALKRLNELETLSLPGS
jgi:arylsulfatase